ncbi:MAG: HAD hydrolase family protein [Lachnospiraceae bacterium]|nr:HAD hydrolase family protein [Lachnospiraceae bacterium]
MIVFYSDLDNTLIYSYRREIGGKKRCVEVYQGREISFMSEYSYHLLQEISKKALFIPVTTRTMEQYQRIDLGIGIPEYALVCNGGILLVNGQRDDAWYEESRNMVQGCQEALHWAAGLLEKDNNVNFEIRNIEQLFLFTKSAQPAQTAEYLRQGLAHTQVDVFSNGAKVYAVPKKLTKGMALCRFRRRIGSSVLFERQGQNTAFHTIAAGDSEFDIPMLQQADVALAPCELHSSIQGGHIVYPEQSSGQKGLFADFVLRYVEEKCILNSLNV